MGEWIGVGRRARRCYGFDEVAIVPADVTIDPDEVELTFELANYKFSIPILAAAMDAVVDDNFAIALGKLGGLAVMNIEGLHVRYENPHVPIRLITQAKDDEVTNVIQKVYSEPIKEELVWKRISRIKEAGCVVGVAVTPQRVEQLAPIAKSAGADILFIQGTVVTAKYLSKGGEGINFGEVKEKLGLGVVVGNCVTFSAALQLIQMNIDGILVGVGPGSACTTRGVLGIGVGQVTATIDCAAARDLHYKRTGKYVPIITDGGMRTAGDVCKAIAAGADAVMLGAAFAKTEQAPGGGYHWGMAMPHRYLPRGTRIHVGTHGTLEEILYGPSATDDGTQNIVGALRMAMGMCGAKNIQKMHEAELIIAPSIQTEGKILQKTQRIGMGR